MAEHILVCFFMSHSVQYNKASLSFNCKPLHENLKKILRSSSQHNMNNFSQIHAKINKRLISSTISTLKSIAKFTKCQKSTNHRPITETMQLYTKY